MGKLGDALKKFGKNQAERNREAVKGYTVAGKDQVVGGDALGRGSDSASVGTRRRAFGSGDIDTSQVLADAQEEFGGILGGSGRRGSQARSALAAGSSNIFQDALNSSAYSRLLDDPGAIANKDVQNELSALGIDWQTFASGSDVTTVRSDQLGDETGRSTETKYSGLDVSAFSEYLKNQANPFAVLRGEQGGISEETARASGDLQVNLDRAAADGTPGTVAPTTPPSLLSGIAEPANARSVKRV